jgi:hypothetical protein
MSLPEPSYKTATTLDEVYQTLSTEPLMTVEELNAFYREEINQVRGSNAVDRMALGLRLHKGGFYKAFLMGHSGVGKSTELTRLALQVTEGYEVIRFSATRDLNPASFKPFDVLLLMMIELAEQTARFVEPKGFEDSDLNRRLKEIRDWFGTETTTLKLTRSMGAEASAGIGTGKGLSILDLFPFMASLKGELKYASTREDALITYRMERVSDLMDLANRLLDTCNIILKDRTGKSWLIIGEDFDKPGIPTDQVEAFFLTYANIIRDLRGHLIFTLPISLAYSSNAPLLPVPTDRKISIPDTPVYTPDHEPCKVGRVAVGAILNARVSPELFEADQGMRLIVASGGNLRTLFSLTITAVERALLRPNPGGAIGEADVTYAIHQMQLEYQRSLGQSPFDKEPITYEEKAARLVRIYHRDRDADVSDPCLFSLLRARAVQEFNGEGWYGVHPLVVNLLHRQGHLKAGEEGTVPGGAD